MLPAPPRSVLADTDPELFSRIGALILGLGNSRPFQRQVLLAFGYFVVKLFNFLPGPDITWISFKLFEKPVAFSFERFAFFGPIDCRVCHQIHLAQVCALKRNFAPLGQSGRYLLRLHFA
jgi:hypothetical protein